MMAELDTLPYPNRKMADPQLDDIGKLIARTDASLQELTQSGAMRSDPYRLALGVLVSVSQLLASVSRKPQPTPAPAHDTAAFKADVQRIASQQGRALGDGVRRLVMLRLAGAIGGAFIMGAVLGGGALYSLQPGPLVPVLLAGDAMLCQASGVRVDAEQRRWYPALPVRAEPVARR